MKSLRIFGLSAFLLVALAGVDHRLLAQNQLPSGAVVTRDGEEIKPSYIRDYQYNTLQANDLIEVFLAPPCIEGSYYVSYQLYDAAGNPPSDTIGWSANMEVELQYAGNALWTRNIDISSGEDVILATVFHDNEISCDDDYFLKINSISTTGNAPVADLYFTQKLYRVLTAAEAAAQQPITNYAFNCTPDATNPNRFILGWNAPAPPVLGYEVEWVYIDEESDFDPMVHDAFTYTQPVRVEVSTNSYVANLYYPAGSVYFRVRAITSDPAHPGHRILNPWEEGGNNPLPLGNHQADRNWQVVSSYAEEGKNKKVMSYFDAGFRNRQTLTNLSSEDLTVIAESRYDYEGRNVLQTLPAPSSDTRLNYKFGFNEFQSSDTEVTANTDTDRLKFHYDNELLANSVLASTTGSGRYYSSANDFVSSIHRDYVPDSEGYPYTQTVFSRDNTGRVLRQSGVGSLYRIDNPDRNTRFYYGDAAPEELNRLFGSNAGVASHFKKNLVVDPNKQVTVSYLDQEGRVVATAMAGDKPTNMDGLPSFEALDYTPILIDIRTQNETAEGKNTITHTILNTVPTTNYDFHYNLSAFGANLPVIGCTTCTYDLRISITNPDGEQIDLQAKTGNQGSGKDYEIFNISASDCTGTTATVQDVAFSHALDDIGDYTIVKELTPHDLDFDIIRTQLLSDATITTQIAQIELDNQPDLSECNICTDFSCLTEGAGVLDLIKTEVVQQNCENIRQGIIVDLQNQGNALADITDTMIQNHVEYCRYEFCIRNKESDIFDVDIMEITSWPEALQTTRTNSSGTFDFTQAVDIDPYFNTPGLDGVAYKGDMQTNLANIQLSYMVGANSYILLGTIAEATDPTAANFRMDADGTPNPSGAFHAYFYDLQDNSAPQEDIDKHRWQIYYSLYTRAKLQVKKQYANDNVVDCPSLSDPLDDILDQPDTEAEIAALGDLLGITGPVTEEQLDIKVQSILFHCNVTVTSSQENTIREELRTYFDSDPNNHFRVIIEPHLATNPSLGIIQGILTGCDLSEIAVAGYPEDCSPNTQILFTDFKESFLCAGEVFTFLPTVLPPGSIPFTAPGDTTSIPSGSPQPLGCSVPSSERDILIALYEATDGDNWIDAHPLGAINWKDGSGQFTNDVCSWTGIEVTNGNVTKIDLQTRGLTGEIPIELAGLQHLKQLWIRDNNLHGSIP